ncbi:MAG: hypothetical protein CFH01_00829 [Alphaproteobacteria bacterium MarineAlpha2_Bin1]|nr:MAG: hypothetical protein CFH01_00829 [Alphaproteobacteria bacterium MarineAlpha2_Bin1]
MGKNKEQKNILAIDFFDLDIISSMVQDSIILKSNMKFLKKQRSFIVLANRFKWEERDKQERIYSIIRFQGVLSVKTKSFSKEKENLPLELLAINYQTDGEHLIHIYLHFSGGAIIDLEVECVECILKDLSESWKTKTVPNHNLERL